MVSQPGRFGLVTITRQLMNRLCIAVRLAVARTFTFCALAHAFPPRAKTLSSRRATRRASCHRRGDLSMPEPYRAQSACMPLGCDPSVYSNTVLFFLCVSFFTSLCFAAGLFPPVAHSLLVPRCTSSGQGDLFVSDPPWFAVGRVLPPNVGYLVT